MESTTKIGTIEAIFLVCIALINHLISNLPKIVFNISGSASVLNMLYLFVLIGLLTILFLRLFRPFKNKDIIDIAEFLGGKILKILLGILYLIFFLAMAGIILRTFADGIHLTYFPNVPIALFLLFFIIAVVVATNYHNKAITRCNLIITPIMIVSLIIPLLVVNDNFAIERIFPLFGYGLNETFFYGATNIFVFAGLSFLFFIQPLLKKEKDFKKVTLWSISLCGALLFFSIVSLLCSLPFVFNIEELSPIYLLVRSLNLGNFFQRPEALFSLIWILAIISFVSICVMFSTIIFQKIATLNKGKPLSACFSGFVFLVAFLPQDMSQVNFLESTVYKYYSIALVFFISFGILILAYFKNKRLEKRREQTKS